DDDAVARGAIGGSFAGCAAARQAAARLPDGARLLMVVPERALGSTGTVGGQNFFDLRRWHGQVVTRGSLTEWLAVFGQGYPTGAMADRLYRDVVAAYRDRIDLLVNTEIETVRTGRQGGIESITVCPVRYDPAAQAIVWAGPPTRIRGEVFIDASETGRLARLAGLPHTVGRQDLAGDRHQQAVTLTFQLRGIDVEAAGAWRSPISGKPEFFFSRDADGTWVGWGGANFVWRDPVITAYNNGPHPFTIKGYSIAENTPGVWWANVLLMHNVDGRRQELDRGTPRWPDDAPEGSVSTDQALAALRAEIASPRFLAALRRFPGFAGATLVRDGSGRPITAEILYLRETIHGLRDGGFALTADQVRHAPPPGDIPEAAGSPGHIGLGFYWIDINGYLKGEPVQTMEAPPNPVYIPADILTNPAVPNLLTPGYAQSTDSTAWAAMRVIPNLTVCGDAAGILAARRATASF
ncbi:MAG: FAD-dependent oxidoreductase, partial [Thermoanaerobacterales bacterium]|nr:FAD-dependent oxidoreductase [Thermoanaerobacterales bacterium]